MSNVKQNPSRYPYRDEFLTLAEALLDIGRWLGEAFPDNDAERAHAIFTHSQKLRAICREMSPSPSHTNL